jgi:hypothetical protein
LGSLTAGLRRADGTRPTEGLPESRLFRVNDSVLIALLVVPQLVWLGLVAYLLHLHP